MLAQLAQESLFQSISVASWSKESSILVSWRAVVTLKRYDLVVSSALNTDF